MAAVERESIQDRVLRLATEKLAVKQAEESGSK
jgi:hypothetical protein